MPDSHYIVLLNDALKNHLLSLSDRERGRMREKFEFLENGFWDAGVRVKKLRGVAGRVIFEARLSKGDRLLFTLGDHRGRTAIYVWGIARHDDINARAVRIAPRNAPFLDFAPLDGEDRTDLSIDTLPREWFSQEDVEQKVPEDYGPQRWLVLDDEEWRRLLSSPDAGSFEAFLFLTREQEELLRAVPPVLLSGTAGSGKTTLSVYYLLRGALLGKRPLFITYNPLLKSLAERIHAGLIEKRQAAGSLAAPRFLVFRDLLREILNGRSRDFPPEREVGLSEFTQIFNDHKDHRKYDAELVWEEIRAIVKGSKLPLAPARYAQLASRFISREISPAERGELREYLLGLQELSLARRVDAFISRRTSLGDYQGFLRAMRDRARETTDDCRKTLEEILRQVQKRASDFTSPLLSAEEYLALGKKRAPSFLYDRRDIYSIAEFYQERLLRSGRWDEIDLSKAALRLMDGAAEEFSYDLVVCDEVQDLTDVQVSLLFRLAADPRAVVLTGDPRQIINPSGFRWEEVKNKLYERGLPVPIVHRLSLNFRCVGSIVRLSNALLDIKAGLVGLSDTDTREEWKFGGRPPLVLSGFKEEEALERIDFRAAGRIILARTAEERDGLKRALATELVFTIAEAKGLEFDTILLWKFCGDPATETLWKTIRSGEPLADARIPHVRHELALLYVAVTRARNTLIIYDGVDPSVIWEIDAIASLVFRTAERERLAELMNAVSSPEEWEAQGDYFLGHEHYAAARECFKNAGNEKKLDLASAFLALLQGDQGRAAALFESSGERERAADCYEHAGNWRRALGLWKDLGEKRRAALCAVRVSELDGDFPAAARGWEALGEPSRAWECWEKAGAFDRVGRALAAAGQYERAARLLEKAKLPLEAAACLARIGREERAADLYVQAGELKLAVRLYKKTGSDEKLLRCYRRLEDHMAIVQYYESRGDVRKAIETLHSYTGASEERRAEVLASIPPVKSKRSALKAAVRYAALGMPEKAGSFFLRAGEIEIAAQEMEKAGDFRGLSQSYMQMSRYLDAARALEKADLDEHDMVEQVQRILYRHFSAGPANEKKAVQALHAEALRMKSEGRLAPALARFRLLQDEDNVREICLQKGWHEDAIRYFLNSDNLAQAKKYAEVNSVTVSEQFVRAIIKEHWVHPGLGSRQREDLNGLLFALLDASLRSAPREMARERIEKFFYAAFGRTISVNLLPRAAFDLLLLHRVANVIISILRYSLQFRAPSDPHLQAFISALSRVARDSADPDLAACAAYASNSDSFEQQVTTLALTDANIEVIATSRSRYPEAVVRMNSMGRGAEAESFCRFHGDPGLAARIAEERGDARDAARQYMDARDFPAAIRCFTAAKDERGIARAYERMGQVDAALAIWKKIGNKREVQRLHKKYPLAGPAVDAGQKELF